MPRIEPGPFFAFHVKALNPREENDNWRPGIEVYFKSANDAAKAEEVINKITQHGVDGFTLIKDPRERRGNQGEDTGKYIGLRLQYVPEIFMRWADKSDPIQKAELDILLSGDHNAITGLMNAKMGLMRDALDGISTVAEVAYSSIVRYDTLVIGKENYDEYTGSAAKPDKAAGSKTQFGKQSSAEAIQAAAIRLGIEPTGRVGSVDVFGGSEKSQEVGMPIAPLQTGVPTTPLQMGDEIDVRGEKFNVNSHNFGFPTPPATLPDDHPLLMPTMSESGRSAYDTNYVRPNGQTTNQLHVSIVNSHFAGKRPVLRGKPTLTIMAGGGGAGKGYVKKSLSKFGILDSQNAVDIDPDAIKVEMIPEFRHIREQGDHRAAAVTHEESSYLANKIYDRALRGKFNIILDKTMANSTKGVRLIQDAIAAGYDVDMNIVLQDARIAAIQAMKRAPNEGRYVPPSAFLSAHKGIAEAIEDYLNSGLLRHASIWDNRNESRQIAELSNGELTFGDKKAYDEIVKNGKTINPGAMTLREIYQGGQDGIDSEGATRPESGQALVQEQSGAGRGASGGRETLGRQALQSDSAGQEGKGQSQGINPNDLNVFGEEKGIRSGMLKSELYQGIPRFVSALSANIEKAPVKNLTTGKQWDAWVAGGKLKLRIKGARLNY